MDITVNETHLKLLDRIVEEGSMGASRQEVFRRAVLDHIRYVREGGGTYDTAPSLRLQARKPAYGEHRLNRVLEPVTGKALPVYRGEVLRISLVDGHQCVDFNAYNLHDYKEYMDCTFMKQWGALTGPGTVLWTGSPYGRPILTILDNSASCDQYHDGHRCNAIKREMQYGLLNQPNCNDTFGEAIREYDLTPDETHVSYNFWMRLDKDASGRQRNMWHRGKAGDYVEMVAVMDTLAVPVICGGDLSPNNGMIPSRIALDVYAPSSETIEFADFVQGKFGSYKSQQTAADFKHARIRTERELKPNPDYRPDYIPARALSTLRADFEESETLLLAELMQTEEYGDSVELAALVAFVRWFVRNRVRETLPRIDLIAEA